MNDSNAVKVSNQEHFDCYLLHETTYHQ